MLNFLKKYYKYCLLVFLFCYFLKNRNLTSGLLQNKNNNKNTNSSSSAQSLANNIFISIQSDPIKKNEMDKIKNTFAETSIQKENKTQAIQQFEVEITPIINKSCQGANISLASSEYTSIKKDVFTLIENYVDQSGTSAEIDRGLNEAENLVKDVMPTAGAALMAYQGYEAIKGKKSTPHDKESSKEETKKKSSIKENAEEPTIKSKEGFMDKVKNKINKKNNNKKKNNTNEEDREIEMKDNLAAKKASKTSSSNESSFSEDEEFEDL